MWRLFVAAPLLLPLAGCDPPPGCSATTSTCTRVLFIGNSYTYVNDLPSTFAALAAAGGHGVETAMLATGGATLAQHAADPATKTTLAAGRWNVVVLQDQSQIPAVEASRDTELYPASAQLVGIIRAEGAQPLFFITWGHRDGWPEAGLNGYAAMQGALDDGYRVAATAEHVGIAPVGDAWAAAMSGRATADLWQADGSHPTTAGTYLAACVFYAAIFHQSPEGVTYTDGLDDAVAHQLQRIAAQAVRPR